MRTVFGIDVSKSNSVVVIFVNGEKVKNYSISNDSIGFSMLLEDLRSCLTLVFILAVSRLFWKITAILMCA